MLWLQADLLLWLTLKSALFVPDRQIQSNSGMFEKASQGRESGAVKLSGLWQLASCILLALLSACGAANSENRQTKELIPPNLQITTYSQMIGGVAGNQSEPVQVSLEFVIAPVISGVPNTDEAMVAVSDGSGQFQINLGQGKYWIGAKEQLDNPVNYGSAPVMIQSQRVEIVAGKVTRVNVYRRGYAP